MNAQPLTIETDNRLAETSWPNRWDACKGTDVETACLLSIAAETERADLSTDQGQLHIAAYDAAHSPDERADFIEAMEEIFADWLAEELQDDANYQREAWGRELWNNHVTFGMVS